MTQEHDRLIAASLALSSTLLYACTAAPSVATLFDDSLEFQVVAPTLGIAHPSGYPLYTLLGKLATLLIPFRDPAGRLNLLSALCAGAAIGVLYLLAQKIAGSRAAAAVSTATFAISPAWWSQATLAEVYALNGLIVAVFLYALLRWEESRGQESGIGNQEPQVRGQESKSRLPPTAARRAQSSFQLRASNDAWLVVAALAFGLGLAHHRTIALLLPAALVLVLWADPRLIRQPRRWGPPLLCALAPLLLYLYLPFRGRALTSLDGTYLPTLAGTLDWMAVRGYSIFLTGNPFVVQRGADDVFALFLQQLGALALVAACAGLVTLWRFSRRRFVFLLTAMLAESAFALAYKVQDVEVFFIPACMLAVLWAAIGLTRVFDAATRQAVHAAQPLRLPAWARLVYLAAWLLSLVGIVLFYPVRDAAHTWAERDRSAAWGVYDQGQDMIASIAPGGRMIGLLGETTLVRYFRDVLGQRPDVEVIPADAEAARLAAVDAGLAAGRPVYLTRDLPGAAGRYSLDAAGPLIAVRPKATPASAPAGQPVGAGIFLTDARTEVRHRHSGPVVRLILTWAAAEPVGEELKVSARLLDAARNVVVQDDRVPVHFAYPTTAWVPGEPVVDVYDLALPSGAPSGSYCLRLILYRAADGSEVGSLDLPAMDIRR